MELLCQSAELVGQSYKAHLTAKIGLCKPRCWDTCVGDAIARVQHNACCAARSIQGQHGLDGHIHRWHIKCLEHDLGHFLSVALGVQGRLSQQDWMLLRCHPQLIVEGVMPDLLHVIPIGHNTMLDGVLEGQNTSLGLGLIPNISILRNSSSQT